MKNLTLRLYVCGNMEARGGGVNRCSENSWVVNDIMICYFRPDDYIFCMEWVNNKSNFLLLHYLYGMG